MRESTLVRSIQKKVREKHPLAYVRKIADRYTRGIPDLLIVFRVLSVNPLVPKSAVLFVETKAKDGRVSKIQAVEHEAIKRAGGYNTRVLVADDADTVLGMMEAMGAL